ncbi:hypothetical protein Dimus_028137 [Dionaea muscipula]
MFPEAREVDKDRFVRGVNQFLEFYQGDKMPMVILAFCLRDDSASEIDRWLSSFMRKGTKSLVLDLLCRNHCCLNEVMKPGSYVIRGEALACAMSRLRGLTLKCCILPPNLINRFHGLSILQLWNSPLDSHDSRSLFLGLVNLRVLEMFSCKLPVKLFLGSLPLLKHFDLRNCSGIGEIELSNSNLIKFQCVSEEVIEIVFTSAPKLLRLSYSVGTSGLKDLFNEIDHKFPMLKALSVYTIVDWTIDIPKEVGVFGKVTILRLCLDGQTRFDIIKMVSILKAFPFLKKLILQVNCHYGTYQKIDNYHNHSHLQIVEIYGLLLYPWVTRFGEYLLKHASQLKMLKVRRGIEDQPSYSHGWPSNRLGVVRVETQPWSEGERLKVYRRLKKLAEPFKVKVIVQD